MSYFKFRKWVSKLKINFCDSYLFPIEIFIKLKPKVLQFYVLTRNTTFELNKSLFLDSSVIYANLEKITDDKKFHPENECSRVGGICIERDDCPLERISMVGGCPTQKKSGAVCCHSCKFFYQMLYLGLFSLASTTYWYAA